MDVITTTLTACGIAFACDVEARRESVAKECNLKRQVRNFIARVRQRILSIPVVFKHEKEEKNPSNRIIQQIEAEIDIRQEIALRMRVKKNNRMTKEEECTQ